MASIKSVLFATTLCSAILAAYPAAAADAVAAAKTSTKTSPAQRLADLAEHYYDAWAHFDPVNATINGDNRYDAELTLLIKPDVRARYFAMLHEVQTALMAIDRSKLAGDDLVTFDTLNNDLNAQLGLEPFPDNLLPIHQMECMPVMLANFASGQSVQPIFTVAQYQAYLKRIALLPEWIDAAIANMRTGIKSGVVQSRVLVADTLPQIKALDAARAEDSAYYAAIKTMPAAISAADQARLAAAYRNEIGQHILPALRKLAVFLEKEYLPATRTTAGWGALPNGQAWYRAWIKAQTTTSMAPEEIHAIGLREMTRIDGEIAKLAPKLGYTGSPAGIGPWLAAQPANHPFKTDAEVLDAYRKLNATIAFRLPELFNTMPRAKLDIRPEPELTRETASDHYNPGAPDGSRPGVFWAVITDPTQYRNTRMTSLFLHEGQPGHHFQLSRQLELTLPKFRQFSASNAYVEGWALYAETLGRELGLYTDPNAYAGNLLMDRMRAARLVVDTGLHAMGWTREQTIAYLREHNGDSEAGARNATERYMAWPAQALGYKLGALRIQALRQKAAKALGANFSLAGFHDAVLASGAVPLDVLETNIDTWIAQQPK